MDFRILGPFEVVGMAGPIGLRGAKRRGLLACLVAHAGQPMSTDRLVEELWGDGGSEGAGRTVQTYVSQLRKLLRGQGAGLEYRPGGYVLEVDPGDVDAHRFEREVRAAAAEPDLARRLAVLDGALDLWRGPPLGEFTGAGWADHQARRLEALHLQAQQRRYDALLDLDRAGEALAELELSVRAHPLDERFWAQYMLALYRSARQADALGAYQQARRHLVDQLGIEPGPELVDLEHRILEHDPTLVARAGASATVEKRRVPASGAADGWYPRTFLLTDIVDSVSLWERDPMGMSEAVGRHDAVIQGSVSTSGGELVRARGEGGSTLSVFAHPCDALAAAVAAQEAVAGERWPSTAPFRIRAGVHTGDAEDRDGDWYGPAVNRAARLRALADGGQTLVSGVTAGLVADRLPEAVRLLYRGRRVLRGIERPEEVWELVAADDPRLTGPASGSSAATALPLALTRFVGRAGDVQQLVELVADARMVTLTGPGGSGKTRLALEVARYAQRRGELVWLAELAPLRDANRVVEAVAVAVGLQPGDDPLGELPAHCEAMNGLVVLDNCEHVLDTCADVARLLLAAPGLHLLATSRESLGVAGERLWPVQPLAVPGESLRHRDELAGVESVVLLLDRATAVRPDITLGEGDVASVKQISRALDGVPLAIELAAGRLRSLSFADLANRLGDQVAVLTRHGPAADGDSRHSTLRMTLDWSYDLLTEQQQMLARRLSAFAGGFRLDAVEAVCAGDFDVLDGIDELVAKSLVTFDGVTARYRLLEPLRQYLAGRLAESGEADAVGRAHAGWTAGLCERMGTRLMYEDQKARSLRLREESGNIDVALRWALDHRDNEVAVRIVGSLGEYWLLNDQASGRRWCATVIESSSGAAPRRRAKALLGAGMVAQSDGAWDRSIAWLRDALAIYEAERHAGGRAACLFWLGRCFAIRWDPDRLEADAARATRCFEEGLRLSEERDDRQGAGWFRIWLSSQAFGHDDLDRAEELSRRVLASSTRHPVGQALCNLGFIAYRRGHHDTAVEHLQDAAAIYRDLGDQWQLAATLVELAAQAAVADQGEVALQALAESTRVDQQIGRVSGRSYSLAVAAAVHLARGEAALATAALGAHDAYPITGTTRPWVELVRSINWLAEVVDATRAQLDPAAVRAAAAAARAKRIDELIDWLVVQPAADALDDRGT